MVSKILLLFLFALFPFCTPQPALADLQTSADVPLVPKPDAEVVAFGLQAVRIQAGQKLPITALDVFAGQRQLSSFSILDQAYIRDQFQKYEVSPPRFTEDIALHSTAKSALLPHDPYAQGLQNPSVRFVLHPYLELAPDAPSAKNDITAYGQPVDANNLRFAEFLRSLSPLQKARVLHISPLTIGSLSPKQRLFVSDLWQASSHPECVQFCSMPNTQVTVGFYLEAIVVQSYRSGSVPYHLQLPQPIASHEFFRFNAIDGQQGQVWMRF